MSEDRESTAENFGGPVLLDRLAGLQQILMGVHAAGKAMSSSSTGVEREHLVNTLLRTTIPPAFRFGHGDISDGNNEGPGQVDVVMELQVFPSVPLLADDSPRLYLAEGVGAVIEVKSNLQKKWSDVVDKARDVSRLRRKYGQMRTDGFYGHSDPSRIPFFAVGYVGWKQMGELRKKLEEAEGLVDGLLVIDRGLYVSGHPRGIDAEGPSALWGLICSLMWAARSIIHATTDPAQYAAYSRQEWGQ